MGYSQCRLVKDHVGRLHERCKQSTVANVAMYETNRPSHRSAPEILGSSADHVVEGYDFGTALVAQQFDDVGADESCSTSHQNSPSFQISQRTLLSAC